MKIRYGSKQAEKAAMLKNKVAEDRIEVFKGYADLYDVLYDEKDYAGEAGFILEIIRRYSENGAKTLLDVGCGTGRHLVSFARTGIKVTGFDVSKGMIRHAKERIAKAGREEPGIRNNLPVAKVADARSFSAGKAYDCTVSMFAVIGYLTTNEDLLAALQNIRRHVKRNGLFIFDVWFGPAVLFQKPETRVKEFNAGDVRTIRMAVPEPDYLRNVVSVHYRVLQLSGHKVVREVRETHRMRFFFIPELEFYLQQSGFTILKVCPLKEIDREPGTGDWNITVVARAV